jgi:sulfate permease, SulP family
MESIAVATVYAAKSRTEVDPNQELVALGAANLIGAFFRAFPTTGGFSRTAVNAQAGARTTLASLVSAGIIGLTLLFLTRFFETLPNAVLAAIVLLAVANLFDWREALHLWKVDRQDLAMMALTFGATLALGIEEGIVVGVIASLGALVYGTSRPHAAVLGRLPGTDTFRNLARYPDAVPPEGMLLYRLDSGICFANVEFLKDQIRALVETDVPPDTVIFDFHAVNGMDSTALHHVDELLKHLRSLGIDVAFAGVKGPVMDRFRRAGLADRIGNDRFHFEVSQAVEAAEGRRARPKDAPALAYLAG